MAIRKCTAQFISILAERMGAGRLLSGAKDVTDKILPVAAQFATDGGSETRCVCTKSGYQEIVIQYVEMSKMYYFFS